MPQQSSGAYTIRCRNFAVLAIALVYSTFAAPAYCDSGPDYEAELTRAAAAKAINQPDWKKQFWPAMALAGQLGRANDWQALEFLLRLGEPALLSDYVSRFTGDLSPSQEAFVAAYISDWTQHCETATILARAIHHYQSPLLFAALHDAYVGSKTIQDCGRWISGPPYLLAGLLTTDLPNVEPQVTELLRVETDASSRRSMMAFLGARRYVPAEDLMLTDLRDATLDSRGDIHNVATSVLKLRTDAGLNAVAQKIFAVALLDIQRSDIVPRETTVAPDGPIAVGGTIGTRVIPGSPAGDIDRVVRPSPVADRLKARDNVVSGLLDMIANGPAETTLDTTIFEQQRLSVFSPEQRQHIAKALYERSRHEMVAHSLTTTNLCKLMYFRPIDFYLVKAFIAKGVDVDAPCEDRWPVTLATAQSDELLSLVLAAGADPNRRDHSRESPTALHVALEADASLGRMKTLLSHGADPNFQDGTGATLLLTAVSHDQLDVVKFMVSHGSDVNVADRNGLTPLQIARDRPDPAMESYLTDHGAHINLEYAAKEEAQHLRDVLFMWILFGFHE